jgi:RNA polymerase sigma-70 factor, ECF subfamily
MPATSPTVAPEPIALSARAAEVESHPFAEFYEAHVSFVWRNVRRLVDVESVVDDLVQEVFVIVVRRFSEFEGRSTTKTWLFGIILNVVRNHRRTLRRRGTGVVADLDAMMDPRPGPDVSMERAQALQVLHELLGELDDDKREVFVLAELEQLTAPEIAEVTGVNVTTVYARLRDGRRALEAAATRYRKRMGRTST